MPLDPRKLLPFHGAHREWGKDRPELNAELPDAVVCPDHVLPSHEQTTLVRQLKTTTAGLVVDLVSVTIGNVHTRCAAKIVETVPDEPTTLNALFQLAHDARQLQHDAALDQLHDLHAAARVLLNVLAGTGPQLNLGDYQARTGPAIRALAAITPAAAVIA